MAVRVILDISPELFFINFEINPSITEGDFKTDKTSTYNEPWVVKFVTAIRKKFSVKNDF